MQDASGVQTFNYGRMGELIENIHTFVVPGGDPYTFAMQWSYDSWNRTNAIVYPDGETVEYGYNNAGKLISLSGVKGSNNYSYVENIKYDKFGSRTKIEYGNGTSAEYTYDATTRRLANLKSYDAQSTTMQNINYQYYNNGNIATVANSANAISNIGGNSSYSHYYDSLSRLTASYGVFTDFNNNNYSYLQTMTYSASGNITEKTMQGSTLLNGAVTSITYDNLYQYATSGKPHAVSSIKDANNNTTHSMSWDANGNMTNLNIPAQSLNRSMCWDEENRLTIVKDDQANLSHYIYNAGGERVWKLTGAIERMSINGRDYFDQSTLNDKTLYTSPYMVVTDREYTKHYYIESQRVTSKLGGGMANNLVDPNSGTLDFIDGDVNQLSTDLMENLRQTTCVERLQINVEPQMWFIAESIQQDNVEEELYFYLSDHLGSSSWITDASGNVDQHLAYMPFGESFIDQRASGHDIRFKFTGKERDSKTGFDYFGARYYSSDISVWLSVDPLASNAPSWSPYNYVWGNPINNIDKDGRWGEKKAQRKHTKAEKKHGPENVGPVVQKNGEYGYHVSKDGFKQHKGNDIVDGADASANATFVYNSKSQNNFEMFGADLGVNRLQRGMVYGVLISEIVVDFWSGYFGGPTGEMGTSQEKASYLATMFLISKIKLPKGFRKVRGARSHGQPVYTNGKKYISPDIDGHLGKNLWKKGNTIKGLGRKSSRDGTYSWDLLERVGD